MSLRIGITGGIGSGKSTVCSIFTEMGIPVYDSDFNAKRLMVEDEDLRMGIVGLLGEEAYLEGYTKLNRKHIAEIVFSAPPILAQLNALVHPAVQKDYEKWHEYNSVLPYTLKEAALIFETGGHKQLDKVIMVYAPEELRIRRVTERDAASADEVMDRIKRQIPDYEKMLLSDFIIFNDGNHLLIPQIVKVHQTLLRLATSKHG
jgi:dephospho-CoA kinase